MLMIMDAGDRYNCKIRLTIKDLLAIWHAGQNKIDTVQGPGFD